VPYLIGGEDNWGHYGGSYGGNSKHSSSSSSSYWGLTESQRRKDQQDFNYFQLGAPHRESNSVLSYPGSGYEEDYPRRRNDYRQQWTRRPGQDGEWFWKLGDVFQILFSKKFIFWGR